MDWFYNNNFLNGVLRGRWAYNSVVFIKMYIILALSVHECLWSLFAEAQKSAYAINACFVANIRA